MLIVVQPVSAGAELARQAVRSGQPCLIATTFPEQLAPEVHDGARVMPWRQEQGLPELLRLVAEAGQPPSGVVAGFEYAVPDAAELARALGLPALSAATAVAVRRKDVMRRRCLEHGIAVPGSVALTSDPLDTPPPFPYPVVVKPVDFGGSLMVSLARTDAEYLRACREILGARAEQVMFHADPHGVVLVEEYVEGPEFSIEGWVDVAGVHLASVTTKFVSPLPRFYELGHIATAPAHSPVGARLSDFAQRVVRAFGISVGPFHIETRIAADLTPVLIEVGARLAGDRIPDLIRSGPGVDLYQATIDAARGTRHPTPAPSATSAGLAYLTAGLPGEFAGTVSGLDSFTDAPEFGGLVWESAPGTALDPDDIFTNRVAHCLFRGALPRVTDLVTALLQHVTVDLVDKDGIRL